MLMEVRENAIEFILASLGEPNPARLRRQSSILELVTCLYFPSASFCINLPVTGQIERAATLTCCSPSPPLQIHRTSARRWRPPASLAGAADLSRRYNVRPYLWNEGIRPPSSSPPSTCTVPARPRPSKPTS